MRTRITSLLVPTLLSLSVFVCARPAHAGDGESLEEVRGTGVTMPRADQLQPAPASAEPDAKDGAWTFGVYGYLRAGYDRTNPDDRYTFVGRNNGFVLDSARVGVQGRNREHGLVFRVSMEGASDVLTSPNTPLGTLSVRLRDAFGRWDPSAWVGIQVGQFKAPFQQEELRGTQDLLFASRAVGVEGVLPGRGLQTPGIQVDRQVGVMISPEKPLGREDGFGAAYYLMVTNGNGSNQLLDDNGKPALVARGELVYAKHVMVGAAVVRNQRTVGEPPNLYEEDDLALTGDVTVRVSALEVFAAATRQRTVFPTVGASARAQLAFHAQAGYRIDLGPAYVMPAYRYAYFHPWQSGGSEGFDTYRVQYHTVGARVGPTRLPLAAWLNYTFTQEEAGRALSNDRLEILGQLTF